MQTFLPYPDFVKSAQCLDNKRLGKQRVECLQILRTLAGITKGWQNHPAVKMWKGREHNLILYGMAMCREWIERGFKDTCYDKISSFYKLFNGKYIYANPHFIGNEEFHNSHRSNLLRKDKEYYSKFKWDVPDNLPYVWPI